MPVSQVLHEDSHGDVVEIEAGGSCSIAWPPPQPVIQRFDAKRYWAIRLSSWRESMGHNDDAGSPPM